MENVRSTRLNGLVDLYEMQTQFYGIAILAILP